MYGKWAYGYWQSKEHYATRDELLGIAREYRKRHIPVDNIVQDWNYWGNNDNWGGMIFDENKYPRPGEMIDPCLSGCHPRPQDVGCCHSPE
jgi:alpha-D-xyloside xylohydrolase